jgi:acetylornithine deacetylase/succinyl-diaminopimelate desuccinylase-like protein
MLNADMIFSADGSQFSETVPNIVVGLRGLVAAEIVVNGAAADLHSGQHGGAVANPIFGLAQIVASMKDGEGRITVAGFYDGIPPLTEAERAEMARVPHDDAAYIRSLGVPDIWGEAGYTTTERRWARPTLELNGIGGGWQGMGIKTVLPAEARAKVTCRLVAGQEPDDVFRKLKAHVEAHVPPGLTATATRLPGSGDPFRIPSGHNASALAAGVLAEVYGTAPVEVRSGGSIPVMTMLLKELGVHATEFAFGLDDENLHAPNEFFRLSSFRIGQTAYCRLLERVGGVR